MVSTIYKDEAVPPSIIYGRVKRRFLRLGASSGIRLHDMISLSDNPKVMPNFQLLSLNKKVQIGTLTLNVANQETVDETLATSKVTAARLSLHLIDDHFVIEVIVISAGECSCKKSAHRMMHCELYQWETGKARDSMDEVYRYYNVMHIRRRKDNVAERMEIGKAVRDLWDEEGSDEIDVELGKQ